MRGTVSLILISLVTIQPVFAQEPAPNPELQGLLQDIPHEVARFTELHASPISLSGGQQTTAESQSDADRVREMVGSQEMGTTISVTLNEGRKIEGPLVERGEKTFDLRVDGAQERFNYNEVAYIKTKDEGTSGLPNWAWAAIIFAPIFGTIVVVCASGACSN